MFRNGAMAGLAALAAAGTAQSQALSPQVQKDLRCFVLYSISVAEAKGEATKQAASLGTLYFFGKLQVAAPELDLSRAVRREVEAMEGNAELEQIGAACDAEFSQRGQELMDLGEALKRTEP